MKTVDQKLKEIENMNRSGYRSKSDIKAEVMQPLETFVGTKAQIAQMEAKLEQKYLERLNEERSMFNKQVLSLWVDVQKDVSQEEGLDFDHKKVKQAWNIAWDEAHSGGYSEVVSYFRTICELLKA